MILDAEAQPLGRVASFAAKKALLGEEVVIINAEKAIIVGKKDEIIARHLKKLTARNKGNYRKGPFHFKKPDRFLRKTIRGMLPYKSYRGREAYRRVMAYIGFPKEEIKRRHNLDLSKEKPVKVIKDENYAERFCITLGELCSTLGGKWQ